MNVSNGWNKLNVISFYIVVMQCSEPWTEPILLLK